MYASHWLNIPSKCCVVPWYTTVTYMVGTLPLESRCGRYLSFRYHRYTMVFCTMCRTLISASKQCIGLVQAGRTTAQRQNFYDPKAGMLDHCTQPRVRLDRLPSKSTMLARLSQRENYSIA